MNDIKELTKEQLEDRVQKLNNELNRSIKIENKLAGKLAQKEHELAILSVQFEEVAQGFEALQKKYEGEQKAE